MSSGSAGGSGAAAGGGGGGGGPCGACKFLRRKCVSGCIFAPYFDSEQGAAHFAAVHKVFGASNVSKLLLHIPPHKRLDAVVTICYEAQSRLRDPIYGCVAHIFALQQQVVNLQQELSYLQAHLAALELPIPTPAPPQQLLVPASQSILDLPPIPAAYDFSAVCGDMAVPQISSWSLYPRQQIEQRQFSSAAATSAVGGGGGGDLQELARELLNRHAPPTVRCRNQASSMPPNSR
ncbi:LOB domain-containing protein 18-like [Salvia miltiorrhiza]|uniref:LOB domain-containing protein 18-like n=1 Tax=Salvia miltiorrhiza TaxID=226208 RepID=UPI0025AD8767|nr:LOB domain-containing protein 18-like [Salvia miltiorrhiza]